jgi:hypothetical protein
VFISLKVFGGMAPLRYLPILGDIMRKHGWFRARTRYIKSGNYERWWRPESKSKLWSRIHLFKRWWKSTQRSITTSHLSFSGAFVELSRGLSNLRVVRT